MLEALSVGRPVLGWDHGGVGELLREWQPRGAVATFDEASLLRGAQAALVHGQVPAVTMPDTLRAMQEATLAVYGELVRNH